LVADQWETIMRKYLVLGVLTLWVSAAFSIDEWPAKPVRLVVPAPAGASNDVAARAIGERLSKMWAQPVVVENRPGAGTTIGTSAVAKAGADGYTLGWVISAHAINPSLYPNLPYDTLRDFSGVTLVYALKPVIVAAADFPARSVDELIALARANPGRLTFASPASGSSVHLVAELFKLMHGLDIVHVPYKGGTAAHPDLMAGRVSFMFDAFPNAASQIRSGNLKVLAVVSDAPLRGYPQLPLLRGLLPSDASVGWNGIVVPVKTPRDTVAKLNADIIAAVRSAEVQELFTALSVETAVTTPAQFDAFIRQDLARWADVVKRAGIKLEGQ
jgi:tripartite-type tricarboxylate transporter receptor subunit TctC